MTSSISRKQFIVTSLRLVERVHQVEKVAAGEGAEVAAGEEAEEAAGEGAEEAAGAGEKVAEAGEEEEEREAEAGVGASAVQTRDKKVLVAVEGGEAGGVEAVVVEVAVVGEGGKLFI